MEVTWASRLKKSTLSTKASPRTNEPTLETSVSFEASETGLETDKRSRTPLTASSQQTKLQTYWTDKGSVGRLSTGSIGLAHESVRWGVWGEWDYKFDYEYMWDNYHGCFCGGEGHGDTVPGVPGCDEACGNESTATCADEMDTKVVQTVGPDMNRCLFGHDTDQDGYPDGLDCDPLNPYLRLDTDGDGWCDMSAESSWAWPVPGSGAQLDFWSPSASRPAISSTDE